MTEYVRTVEERWLMMLKTLYSYITVALVTVSLISTTITHYEPMPEKVSLAEYEALMSERKEMYAEAHKIDSEANYEVTEVSDEVTPEVTYVETDVCYAASEGEMMYLGSYELTAYMWTGNPCADGVYPSCGYTVACNDPSLWHRWIYIEGYGNYYVHDVGGMPSYNIIDVYLGDYDSCVQFGRRSANVYLIN